MTTLASREELISRRDPNHTVTVEPCPKWVRVMHNGEFIADSRRALLLFETRHTPVYYFPREDVRMDLMSPTDLVTQCPYKGDAEYYTLNAGEAAVENVMWAYTAPFDVCPDISDYIAFYWNKVDHWFEEDEEIFVHARDPHKRVDCLPSTRHVRVEQGGVTLAESTRPTLLFETGLPVRYYLPVTDVRVGLLAKSEKATPLPVQGRGGLLHRGGRRGRRGPGVVLPASHVGVRQDRQPGVLLQRARRRVRGRRTAGAARDAVVSAVGLPALRTESSP